MSRAALMCCTALALALSVGAAHAGPEIPWQFHGRWCSQEHKYGTDTLIFGRQGSVADCNMEISRHALVAGGSQFTVQCEPLEIILRRDYRYQYKGKCSVFDKTAKWDLGAPSIVEGTAWITASNLLVIKSKPKPESKEGEPKETAPAAKPEPVPEPSAETIVITYGRGGLLREHTQRFADYRNRKTKVEIRGPCYSACTQITAYVAKADLCIAEGAFFAFHAVRSLEKQEIMPIATHLFYLQQPLEIRDWIDRNGGYENLPLNGFWTMYDRDLWAMGYAKCQVEVTP